MAQDTHTSGPWRAYVVANTGRWTVDNWCPRAGNYDDLLVADCGEGQLSEANARLIADAPATAAERDRLKESNATLVDALAKIAAYAEPYRDGQGSSMDRVAVIARSAFAKAAEGVKP